MSKSKTILAWFEEARAAGHEWADAAIAYANQFGFLSCERVSLVEAIGFSFVWKYTEEGHDFWKKIHESLGGKP